MRVLLLTPPMTQLNAPYPATAYLTAYLRGLGFDVRQADPALLLVLRLFSRPGLAAIAAELALTAEAERSVEVRHFLAHAPQFIATVEPVLRFLQGNDPTLAMRLLSDGYLPLGPRSGLALNQFVGGDDGEDPFAWAFGALGTQDRAKYLASLYITDLAAVVQTGIDERFELARYGEKLAASAVSFTPLAEALCGPPTLVDRYLDQITAELVQEHAPTVVGLSIPFPGNLYGGLRIAQQVKALAPASKVLMGGGYVNTELRCLSETRLFDFVDYVTLDDGERPIELILRGIQTHGEPVDLLRTFVRREGKVQFVTSLTAHDVPLKDSPAPTYDGLPLSKYLSVLEMLNPMHRIWSDGRWNKLTLAHGCYWRKCNFCDISLDYIGRYEEQAADLIVDKMATMIAQTGQSGFHFVDEAAPPKVLLALAARLKARELTATWWGNVRFEKTFAMPGAAERLAEGGLIAVSGGLEVASDRLLKLMQKGVTVEQVAQVTKALTEAGILVHAYLMYGFPTQTEQETIDALERVRQLFAAGCINSAFWHRFSATVHSPIGQEPERFGISLRPMAAQRFAQNDLDFDDPTGTDHDLLGVGLKKALYNYMHGIGLEEDVRFWFDAQVPKARVPKRLIADALGARTSHRRKSTHG